MNGFPVEVVPDVLVLLVPEELLLPELPVLPVLPVLPPVPPEVLPDVLVPEKTGDRKSVV